MRLHMMFHLLLKILLTCFSSNSNLYYAQKTSIMILRVLFYTINEKTIHMKEHYKKFNWNLSSNWIINHQYSSRSRSFWLVVHQQLALFVKYEQEIKNRTAHGYMEITFCKLMLK